MPLNNINIKNFRLSNYLASDTARSRTYHEVYLAGEPGGIVNNHNTKARSNTLPNAGLIRLQPSGSTDNPSGGLSGYWSFGTHDITLGDCEGFSTSNCNSEINGNDSGKWFSYADYSEPPGAYWSHTQNKLKFTDYDPGMGLHPMLWGNTNPDGYSDSVMGIGHDFWKQKLQGEYLGEPYEPTSGQPMTYYRYWEIDTVQNATNSFVADDVVQRVVCVNSMPLNADNTAQQGNIVYCIACLHRGSSFTSVSGENGVTGADIEALGGIVTVNFNGEPTFIVTEESVVVDTSTSTWNDDSIVDYDDEPSDWSVSNDESEPDTFDAVDEGGGLDGGVSGVVADGVFELEFVDDGVEDSDIDDYLGESDEALDPAADVDNDGVINEDDPDWDGGISEEVADVLEDNPNVPDEPLADIEEPNATDYDSVANTETFVPAEDVDATDEADNSGTLNTDLSAWW